MNAKKILLSIVVVMMAIGNCYAQDYELELERARRMMDAGDYKRAAMTLRPLADGGNAEAQYLASKLFARGWGVVKSQSQCLKYLQMSAAQGYVIAVNQMIILYRDQNPAKAVQIAQKYCNQFEELRDQYPGVYLAEAYLMGNGTEKNVAKAMELALEAKDESFTQELKDKIYKSYIIESAQKYHLDKNDLSLLDSIFKDNDRIGDKIVEQIASKSPELLEKLKGQSSSTANAFQAYCYYKGVCGALQHKKMAQKYASQAMQAGSAMGKYYYEKYRKAILPGSKGDDFVIFEMRDETTWDKFYCTQPVECTWQEVASVLKKMGKMYRLPSREEAKLLMKYWMFEETNPLKTMNIWTSVQPGAQIYYWQTYNFKGELTKEEPYHGFVGSVYGGKCWVIGVAVHK